MSALFNYCDDSAKPRYVQLDTLAETHGIEPAHVLADPDPPLVITIGPARYVSREDLTRKLDQRAHDALLRRMGRNVSDDLPEPYSSELADVLREANDGDRFYWPGSSPERSKSEPQPGPAASAGPEPVVA